MGPLISINTSRCSTILENGRISGRSIAHETQECQQLKVIHSNWVGFIISFYLGGMLVEAMRLPPHVVILTILVL
jgi:hypothetical protein